MRSKFKRTRALNRQIQEFIKATKLMLDFSEPFSEFNKSVLLQEDTFLACLYPCLKETIEEFFCAKVLCQEKNEIFIEFETGERLELQLFCKVQ